MCTIGLFSPQHAFLTTRFGFTRHRPISTCTSLLTFIYRVNSSKSSKLSIFYIFYFTFYILFDVQLFVSTFSSHHACHASPFTPVPYSWTHDNLMHVYRSWRIYWRSLVFLNLFYLPACPTKSITVVSKRIFVMVDFWKFAVFGFENTSDTRSSSIPFCVCVWVWRLIIMLHSSNLPIISGQMVLHSFLAHVNHVIWFLFRANFYSPLKFYQAHGTPSTMSKSLWLSEASHCHSGPINVSNHSVLNCMTWASDSK